MGRECHRTKRRSPEGQVSHHVAAKGIPGARSSQQSSSLLQLEQDATAAAPRDK